MKISNVIQWIVSVSFFLFAIVNGFHFTSLFILAAALLIMPLEKLRFFFRNKGFNTIALVSFSIIFFFVGAVFSPIQKEENLTSSSTEEVQQTAETEKDIEESKNENQNAKETDNVYEEATLTNTEELPTKPSLENSSENTASTSPALPGESDSSNNQGSPSSNTPVGQSQPIALADVPPYSGSPFAILRDNLPDFSAEELTSIGYESYAELDALGRCGAAKASCGREIMPAEGEKRGDISSIKPTGWIQAKYDNVSGKYLYNRAHLLGWQLSAENANRRNLITGTRYFNVEGMLPFENMVADYIRETGNHVAYRVTPMYDGNDLLARGVRMEAFSVEDRGDGICFHVFVYNVQPGVIINYATGSSCLEEVKPSVTTPPVTTTVEIPPVTTVLPQEGEVVYRTPTGKRYHLDPDCGGKNSKAVSLDEAKKAGLTPCGTCSK